MSHSFIEVFSIWLFVLAVDLSVVMFFVNLAKDTDKK